MNKNKNKQINEEINKMENNNPTCERDVLRRRFTESKLIKLYKRTLKKVELKGKRIADLYL